MCVCVSLKVASKLLHATSGPVKAVEGGLYQRCHDAAHLYLISTAIPLTIVLHPQPADREREDSGGWGSQGNVPGETDQSRFNSEQSYDWLLWCPLPLLESRLDDIMMANTLTHVQSRVPPQRPTRSHPHGSKCSSVPDGTYLLPGHNLGDKEETCNIYAKLTIDITQLA